MEDKEGLVMHFVTEEEKRQDEYISKLHRIIDSMREDVSKYSRIKSMLERGDSWSWYDWKSNLQEMIKIIEEF